MGGLGGTTVSYYRFHKLYKTTHATHSTMEGVGMGEATGVGASGASISIFFFALEQLLTILFASNAATIIWVYGYNKLEGHHM